MKEIEVIFFSYAVFFSLDHREQLSAKMSDYLCKQCHWGGKLFGGFTK